MLNVHKPPGDVGRRVTMLHEAFTLATREGCAPCLERLLPALDTLLGAGSPAHCAVVRSDHHEIIEGCLGRELDPPR